ncbi:hypothetical protein ILP97_17435 [Amycolatopsis sp. H6(2020)]|nr:hypothetical protein [Amycolatopsis sp. H6(2020)]
MPVHNGTKATARAAHLPQMLWPGWAIRLLPPRGFHTDPFRAVMVLSLLVPGDGRRPVTFTAKHLHPYLSRVLISQVLQHLAQLGHNTVIAALCELTDNLDQHGSPINYERRRTLITPDALTDEQWRRICRATRIHPALGRRFLDAQRYLVTQLTGDDLNDPSHLLKFTNAHDRAIFTSFTSTLSTPVRRALHQHAAEHLRTLRIDEPVTWEPPREWAPRLVPPGREPADIDLDRLHQLIFDDGVTVADAASTLATHSGWQRLHRFRAVMGFATIDTAASHLGVDQSTLVRPLQRLEADIGTTIYHRATTTQDMHPPSAARHCSARSTTPTPSTTSPSPRNEAPRPAINHTGRRHHQQ